MRSNDVPCTSKSSDRSMVSEYEGETQSSDNDENETHDDIREVTDAKEGDCTVCFVDSLRGASQKFVARITKTISVDERSSKETQFEVEFLKPTKRGDQFYITDEPLGHISDTDIVKILPQPISGGTARTRNILVFNYDVEMSELK